MIKKMQFSLFTSFLCLFPLLNLSLAATWKCNNADKAEVNKLVAQIMTYGWEGRDYPETKAKLKPYCKETITLLDKVDAYKAQCLKGQAKSIVSVYLYSVRANFNAYCRNPNSPKTTQLISFAPCANSASSGFRACSDDFEDILGGINKKKGLPSKAKLAQLCCGSLKVARCIERTARRTNRCTASDQERLATFVKSFYERTINTLCGSYTEEGSNECANVKLLSGGAQGRSKGRAPSVFSSLVAVLSSL